MCCTFFFMEPRATPDARLALGAAFLRAARFTFLRSALSVIDLVFIRFDYSILLDSCVLFHQLLQTVAGKAYRELSILAIAFATEHRSPAVFGMPDHGAGAEAATAGGWARHLRRHSGIGGWRGRKPGLGIGGWGTGTLYRVSTLVPVLEELLDVIDGVVRFASEEIGPGGLTRLILRTALARLAEIFHQSFRHLAKEARRDGGFLLATAKTPSITRRGQEQPFLRSRHADVAQTPFLFH